MADFPEDDERDLEKELAQAEDSMDMMARDWPELRNRRDHLRKEIKRRQIDPLVEKALKLAQDLGHTLGANEALYKKIKHLEKRIDVRDKKLDSQNDYDEIMARMQTAEAKIARRRRR